MTPGPTPEKHPASLASVVSSLLVLMSVFFFINSACLRGSSCGDSSECDHTTIPPAGAAIAIVEPKDGAIVGGDSNVGLVTVKVVFSAHGVRVRNTTFCGDDAGHFLLLVRRECGGSQSETSRVLTDGGNELNLQLAPGKYALIARFDNSFGGHFEGLVATTHITVAGEQGTAGAPACP